tara:strand:- start:15392 stop:16288 length:897 start_codon:yes stop_codon:yes gene_type:complete
MAKSKKKQALGKGLSALLDQNDDSSFSTNDSNQLNYSDKNIVNIPLNYISTNPFQPRTNFNEEKINELAISIRELGLIQPITVKKINDNSFQLVTGERRLRAAISINLKTIPCYVREINDQQSLEMALVENIQREDLDPIEIALSYKRLIDEIHLTQDDLSEKVGKKRSTITNYIRLLKLDPIIQTGIRDGFISMGHGRALISIEDIKAQISIYEKIVKKGLSVRDTEALANKLKSTNNNPVKSHKPIFAISAAEKVQSNLKTPVSVKIDNNGKGSLIISFSSQKELNRIINIINGTK